MLARQGGACAICKQAPTRRPLFVDHCHATGEVRGLLCHGCNAALGFMRDDHTRTSAATEYLLKLKRHDETKIGAHGRPDAESAVGRSGTANGQISATESVAVPRSGAVSTGPAEDAPELRMIAELSRGAERRHPVAGLDMFREDRCCLGPCNSSE